VVEDNLKEAVDSSVATIVVADNLEEAVDSSVAMIVVADNLMMEVVNFAEEQDSMQIELGLVFKK
jgi:hypothetical protein